MKPTACHASALNSPIWQSQQAANASPASCMTTTCTVCADAGAGARPPPAIHACDLAPDLVQRKFVATDIDQLWEANMTYVPTWEGLLYLAVVMDVFSSLCGGSGLWCADDLRPCHCSVGHGPIYPKTPRRDSYFRLGQSGRIQPVDATHSLKISAGVWMPSVLRGLSFNCLAIGLSWSCERPEMFMPLGMSCLSNPFVFSLLHC